MYQHQDQAERQGEQVAFPAFMSRVITAGSVLQGDFTAQMKEEEGQGHLTSEVPPSCEWTFYRRHTATLPDSKWLLKAIVKSAYHADPASKGEHATEGNTPNPPKHPL